MLSKESIRKEIFISLNKLNVNIKEDCSQRATINFERFFLSLNLDKESMIGCYYSKDNELDTLEIINFLQKQGYQVALPKILSEERGMIFTLFEGYDSLKKNIYGIKETKGFKICKPRVIIVPMVAFDNSGNRLGYGKGFYDRYLGDNKALTIGLSYSIQQVEQLPYEETDYLLDTIITDQDIIVVNNNYKRFL